MIKIELTSDAAASTRFALSPLFQAMNLLFMLGRRPHAVPQEWRHRAREVIEVRRLRLLASLAITRNGYTPDFLTPGPAEYRPSPDGELHQVTLTPPEQVQAEMATVLGGHAPTASPARSPQRLVLQALERGEDAFVTHLAREVDTFWTHALRPRWADLSARLERDIAERANVTARHGLGTMLASLHRRLDFSDGALSVAHGGADEQRLTIPGLVLVPGAFPRGLMLALYPAAAASSPAVLVYPAAPDDQGPSPGLGELIGGSRAAVLAELAQPRTTGEVAARLGLSPSTVSYHLQVLYRANVLRRTRSARRVYYQTR
ncbi:hypothetical protein CFP65_1988 [Kitasatospora sp. MMS16-BH015]|uniref:ArsR/SmtB family transcription factor n=1 Tax=Kitasatospora sp. MMS16-BH015 TaxID=2018025 RepID=UPI000CA11802|nr:winged helix-turn-helix domain-containing protein [Kitasatospora sp. MMS16-BH015]AUG76853.1 hypothetical protein CFP65_1988 [Kitasatospora sp. MMS16-BH015]